MADHRAIAAVSRTLRALLQDRMQGDAAVTLAPPDVRVQGVAGARVNLYLFQVLEAPELRNQEPPGHGWPKTPGSPPLGLRLRYILTTQASSDDLEDSDLNAQTALGDAMLTLHQFAGRLGEVAFTDPAVGPIGEPILDDGLRRDYENLRLTLVPTDLEDLSRFWSAMSESAFRRSAVYEVSLIQMEPDEPRRQPRPVETRRVLAALQRRPIIERAFVTPAPGQPEGEGRARIGDEITLIARNTLAERLYVRLGALDPIRVAAAGDGRIRLTIPDDAYPADLDNPAPRPIPPEARLRAGPLPARLLADYAVEGVEGGLDAGLAVTETRRFASESALLMLVPTVTGVTPASGGTATILRVTGARLWRPDSARVEILLGDAAISVRAPGPGDPWAAPSETQIEAPLTHVRAVLPPPAPGGTAWPVAVSVDGATSRDAGFAFTLTP
jgi:hypothetical protein